MLGCDGCTICCKIMKVRELEKTANTWCQHCKIGAGCDIYDTRPESCRVYECLWLKTQAMDKPMAPSLRPDRSRVVVGTLNEGTEAVLYVGADRPDAWQRPDCRTFIGELQRRGIAVSVSCGERLQRL